MTAEVVKNYSYTYFGEFGHLNSSCIRKSNTVLFWVPREIDLCFCSTTHGQTFLLVSGRHVGALPNVHLHGVSIQSSVNLGNTLLRIARRWKIAETWFLARMFILQLSIISQILELITKPLRFLVSITWLMKTENYDEWNHFWSFPRAGTIDWYCVFAHKQYRITESI